MKETTERYVKAMAEALESKKGQDIVALHAALAGNDIQRRVRTRMADMQTGPRRIRELYECIELRLGIVGSCGECLLFIPDILPFLFNLLKIIFFQ